ncbi:aminotransferase class III-fold pyridoxal phosphate-dependent enzyme [Lentibacter algarum]|uniref:aminotransferase class III-fold pyridoxal phosphate-dependent enzyme n=1 Tax=Lentibacter algarum TaxID=576131 RepID=UPI00339D4197
MSVIPIIQARLGSTRLPGKVLLPIFDGQNAIDLVVNRLWRSKYVTSIILATTDGQADDQLVSYVRSKHPNVQVIRGDEDDVLGRFYKAAKNLTSDTVLSRITADCPLVDPRLFDEMYERFNSVSVDYLSNTIVPSYPDGYDIEFFRVCTLVKAHHEATSSYDREHVTPYMKAYLRCENFERQAGNTAEYRATLDEADDLRFFIELASVVDITTIGCDEFCEHISSRKSEYSNQKISRNMGSSMSNTEKRFKRAQNVILGGTSLFSKNPNLHHPKRWPGYFKSAKGIEITDLANNSWRDVSFMGIGTNILGYGDDDVDAAVLEAVSNGNMSTLNCYEEVELAERLLELLNMDGLVKFTRSGGEANTVALRIARSATGKSGIAFCGYHGWHDWYLSSNLGDSDALQKHLLSGLSTTGVPEYLRGKVHPFTYNSCEEFNVAVSGNNVGTVIMEPMRNINPAPGFLEHIRQVCTAKGIVLIFDECSSGFRENLGGYSQNFSIQPDIQVFGKTIANGYALNAVVGVRDVMLAAESSFISSTFWSERIGYSAALATISKMSATNSFKKVPKIGKIVKRQWSELFNAYGLDWRIQGTDAIPNFVIPNDAQNIIKTYLVQEMLVRGWLASTAFYVCVLHTEHILEQYFLDFEACIKKMVSHNLKGIDLITLIDGDPSISGFKRLN